jgi:hypothetical protein
VAAIEEASPQTPAQGLGHSVCFGRFGWNAVQEFSARRSYGRVSWPLASEQKVCSGRWQVSVS